LGKATQSKQNQRWNSSVCAQKSSGAQACPKTLVLRHETGHASSRVADFIERLTGDSEDLWRKYGSESCFKTFEEYCDFAEGREMMTFVRFTNFVELENPKTKEETKNILGSLQGLRGKYVNLRVVEQLIT
jgi:hypothetical protein